MPRWRWRTLTLSLSASLCSYLQINTRVNTKEVQAPKPTSEIVVDEELNCQPSAKKCKRISLFVEDVEGDNSVAEVSFTDSVYFIPCSFPVSTDVSREWTDCVEDEWVQEQAPVRRR